MSTIDYNRFPGIPTDYNGRRYRSRLEARWAAYFDLLGWNTEYEPCDLGSWSPDFALWGLRPNFPIYVEVKPIDDWHRETARKMADAVRAKTQNNLLLVGKEPVQGFGGYESIGWLAEEGELEALWSTAVIGVDHLDRYDFFPENQMLCQISWIWEVEDALKPCSTGDLWKQAANLVQWRGSLSQVNRSA